jgi:hypothetical protein
MPIRQSSERAELIKKAMELVESPAKYARATSYGAAKYVKGMAFDKDTAR